MTYANTAHIEQLLDDARFSQSLELPAGFAGRDKPLNVTYADIGYRNEAQPETERVIFFFPGMFATRWLLVAKDEVAKESRIRIISLDRPGFGGTDAVSDDTRLAVSRELVPTLLKHLGIKTVSFACHSAGTLFALDTLLHYPELLDPQRPYLAIAGPWVHPAHTGVVSLNMAHALPKALVSQFDKVVGFVHSYVQPWVSTSAGISDPIVNLFSTPATGGLDTEQVKLEEAVQAKSLDRAHKENFQGISSECLVLLRRVQGEWGEWGDYGELARRVSNAFRQTGRNLTIDVFYAEADEMIGSQAGKGARWFDDCWASKEGITHSRTVVDGSDHDSLWQLRWGVPQRVFGTIEAE
jgi:pimeloyl-ACP methyl ester carboxylesterase